MVFYVQMFSLFCSMLIDFHLSMFSLLGLCYAFAVTDAAVALHVCLSKQEYAEFIHQRYEHPSSLHADESGCFATTLNIAFEMLKEYGVYEESVYPYKACRENKEEPPTVPEAASAQVGSLPSIKFENWKFLDLVGIAIYIC